MRYWDDRLRAAGIRAEVVDAIGEHGLGIEPGPGSTSRQQMLDGWPRLLAMTRQELAAVPGLTDADVSEVWRTVGTLTDVEVATAPPAPDREP